MTTAIAADFSVLQGAITTHFDRMKGHPLFRVDVSGDELWDTYLASFPEGTNPIHKKRREYDCSCCKHFIRAVGNMVAIIDHQFVSLWDAEPTGVHEFDVVTRALSALVKSRHVCNIFVHEDAKVGNRANRVLNTDGTVTTYRHFYLTLPSSAFRLNGRDAVIGQARTAHDVLQRSLEEISVEALETVIDLIKQNSLYRGGDCQQSVVAFYNVKQGYGRLASQSERDAFVWSSSQSLPVGVTHIKNTSIGTLLTDLSSGMDVDAAVRSYEAKVAPANYKRPTALVTKAMIDKAKATLGTLGLTPALERRYATVNDVTVSNLLFVDRSVKGHLKGGVLDTLTPTKAVKQSDHLEEVSLEKFLRDILPVSTGLEVLVENSHAPNFMSLIAPVHEDAPRLFKWDNGFSWSYTGDATDSIKERVKAAGGNVIADLRCSLSWSNYDDLDLHLLEPNGYEIYFPNKRCLSPSHGVLDVDMNAGSRTTRTPVENICYTNRRKMENGRYLLGVHQYNKRESTNVGFTIEVEFDGHIHTLVYGRAVHQGWKIEVAYIDYTQLKGFTLTPLLPLSTASKVIWGVPTHQFRKVTMVMRSPNFWDGQTIGNQHLFFMLEGCRHEGTVRGVYNEFLRSELEPHRKVMELVGSKVRTEESDQQLSGLGFSTTQRNHLVCRVTGSFTRQIKVII